MRKRTLMRKMMGTGDMTGTGQKFLLGFCRSYECFVCKPNLTTILVRGCETGLQRGCRQGLGNKRLKGNIVMDAKEWENFIFS